VPVALLGEVVPLPAVKLPLVARLRRVIRGDEDVPLVKLCVGRALDHAVRVECGEVALPSGVLDRLEAMRRLL
jgi:hypothetical protein